MKRDEETPKNIVTLCIASTNTGLAVGTDRTIHTYDEDENTVREHRHLIVAS